ncbi:MAG: hypothetical protein JST80_08690 [Bdellovibrionales bacterium]|nr:hypothetical protein [Bdellovibrionales bacterium]
MNGRRRVYGLKIWFNGRLYERVEIGPHYQEKHPNINDFLILDLLIELSTRKVQVDSCRNGFSYFCFDDFEWKGKLYRVVVCVPDHHRYIGVVNCFRR